MKKNQKNKRMITKKSLARFIDYLSMYILMVFGSGIIIGVFMTIVGIFAKAVFK